MVETDSTRHAKQTTSIEETKFIQAQKKSKQQNNKATKKNQRNLQIKHSRK